MTAAQTLMLFGVACIVAAIAGGSVEAAGFKFPVVSSIRRQAALAAVGVVLVIIGWRGQSSSDNGLPPPATSVPAQTVDVDYHQLGGSFIVLGPNPGGIFAQSGWWWNEIDIIAENHCADRVYIGTGLFRLYLSSQPTTANAQAYLPTTRGLEFQPQRLPSGWLEPGGKVAGRLVFEVKITPDEETGKSGQYRILRYAEALPCPVRYQPH